MFPHILLEPTHTQFKLQCVKLHRTPDMFRCEFTPSSGEQVEHLKHLRLH
jgi:hypothetical protein